MKTKKCLTILLTLALVLSIAVMAFAANECGHDDDTLETVYTYLYPDATAHVKVATVYRTCNTCFEQSHYVKSQTVEAHSVSRYVYVDDYEESGETYYVYDTYCICGYALGQITTQTRHH